MDKEESCGCQCKMLKAFAKIMARIKILEEALRKGELNNE